MTTRRDILAGAPTLAALAAAATLAQRAEAQTGTPSQNIDPQQESLRGGAEGVRTPEVHGARGDGFADDTDAIEAWLRDPAAPKVAPPSRIYRLTRALDLLDAAPFDADFSGSVLRLEHREAINGDNTAVYGLYLPARHVLRHVTIEGLGLEAMQSGVLTDKGSGHVLWRDVWFRDLQRRAFHVQTDDFIGEGFIRVTDCQTFPGPVPENYDLGAGRFQSANFTIEKLWGEGGTKRCFAFGDPTRNKERRDESGFVAHVYVPYWETLGHSGQALYCNFTNNITFGRVDVLDYHCDVSSNAVYFSRDCRDIAVLSAHVSARGHPLATALNIGGGKRIRVANAYLRSEGRVLRLEGHRGGYQADDVTVEGVFHCDVPEGVTLTEPPILLRNNTLRSGPDRDLRDATIRGRLVLTGRGTIVPPSDASEHSAKGCFLMVDSCTGTVLLDGIEMDTGGRGDVIPIGVGSTGSVARVIVRNMRMRTGDRFCLAAWKGEVLVQGGSTEQAAHEGDVRSVIWAPRNTEAVYRIQGFDAGARGIVLTNGSGHVIVGCIASEVAVPPDGMATANATLR
jgi:hypothetical protein